MWFGTATSSRKLPAGSGNINADDETVQSVIVFGNLGVWIDAELSMRDHIFRACQEPVFPLALRPINSQAAGA